MFRGVGLRANLPFFLNCCNEVTEHLNDSYVVLSASSRARHDLQQQNLKPLDSGSAPKP